MKKPRKYTWLIFEKQVFKSLKKMLLVTHEDRFYHFFMITSCVCSLTSIIMYGGWAALRIDVEFGTFEEYQDQKTLDRCHTFTKEQITEFFYYELIYEIFYLVEAIRGFFTAYKYDQNVLITDFRMTASNYISKGFLYDFIPLIPFNRFIKTKNSRFLYLLKWMRLQRAVVILDPE